MRDQKINRKEQVPNKFDKHLAGLSKKRLR